MLVIGQNAGLKRKEASAYMQEYKAQNADHLQEYRKQYQEQYSARPGKKAHLQEYQKQYYARPENVALRAERAAERTAGHRQHFQVLLREEDPQRADAVSYTHLTLPTKA